MCSKCFSTVRGLRSRITPPAGESGHDGLLRTEPIINPFFCLLKKAEFSLGFCCESVDCSSHHESPKHPAFGIFNSSSCAPVRVLGLRCTPNLMVCSR